MSLDLVREAFAAHPIKDRDLELELVPGSLRDVGGTVRGSLRLSRYDPHGAIQEIMEQEIWLGAVSDAASFPQVLEAAGLARIQLDAATRMEVGPADLFPLCAWGHPDVATAVQAIHASYAELRAELRKQKGVGATLYRSERRDYDAMFEGLEPLDRADRERLVLSFFRDQGPDLALTSTLSSRPDGIDYIERFLFRWTWRNDELATWLHGLAPVLEVAPRQRVLRLFAHVAPDHYGWITETLEAWPNARTELAALAASEPESAEGARVLIEQLDALEAPME